MDTLSDELLYCILSYVDPWTLLGAVQYASKRFRRLVLENHLWYAFHPLSRASPSEQRFYGHWTEIDWYNEWKW